MICYLRLLLGLQHHRRRTAHRESRHVAMHIGDLLLLEILHLLEMTRGILMHFLVQKMMRAVKLQQGRECRCWRLDRNRAGDLLLDWYLSLPRPTLLRLVVLALGIAVGPGVALLALLIVSSSTACRIRWRTRCCCLWSV